MDAVLLRIVETENGKLIVLYNDGKYGKATPNTLMEIFKGIDAVEDMEGEIDGWVLDYDNMEDFPGKTRAYIDEQFILHIYQPNVFERILKPEKAPVKKETLQSDSVKYLTISEYAKIVDKSPPRIRVLCSEGRFPGAIRKGKLWLIPEGTPFPDDKRFVEHPKRPRKQKSEGFDNDKFVHTTE